MVDGVVVEGKAVVALDVVVGALFWVERVIAAVVGEEEEEEVDTGMMGKAAG